MAKVVWVATEFNGIDLYTSDVSIATFDPEGKDHLSENDTWELAWSEEKYCREQFGDDNDAFDNYWDENGGETRNNFVASKVEALKPEFVYDPELNGKLESFESWKSSGGI